MNELPSEPQPPYSVSPNVTQPNTMQETPQLSESELAWQRHVAEAQHALHRQAVSQQNLQSFMHTAKDVQRVWRIISLIGAILILLLLIGMQLAGHFGK